MKTKSMVNIVGLLFLQVVASTGKDDSEQQPTQATIEDEPYFCGTAGEISESEQGWIVEGMHYRLLAQSSAEEALILSTILEASWFAMTDWFGQSPELTSEDLLNVEYYADYTSWQEAIIADGLDSPSGGGLYHPSTETAYLFAQPTLYYSRQLMIHEAIHQFHHQARLGDHSLPGWYMEGHTEYLSHYDWDGGCIRLGRLPLLTQEDRPAAALAQIESLDLQAHFSASESISRPLEWAIFRFFDKADDGTYAEQFTAFRDAMDGGSSDAIAEFTTAFGTNPSSFNNELQDWIRTEQQPMSPLYMEWQHENEDTLVGWSDVFSIAPLKNATNHFELYFDIPESPSWFGGVVLSYEDSSNWVAVGAGSDGRISTFEVIDGSAMWSDQDAAPTMEDGGYHFIVAHGETESTILVNNQALTLPLLFSPSGGAALNSSRIRFTELLWE